MASYVQSIPDNHRQLLISFLKRSHNNSIKILNSLDQISAGQSSPEVLRYAPDRNREYYRFKKRLDEFRIAEECIDFLKKKDQHVYFQNKIAKKILSAQILIDTKRPINAADLLKRAYKKANKYEFLNHQRDCASKLKRLYKPLDSNEFNKWDSIHATTLNTIEVYKSLTPSFNEIVESRFCCEFHRVDLVDFPQIEQENIKSLIKFQFMRKFLEANIHRLSNDHKSAQGCAWELLLLYRNNQVILSRHYYLILIQFMLENMKYLNKTHVVSKAAARIDLLDQFPLHQSFPLLSFHLFELFRNEQADYMIAEIERIRSNLTTAFYVHINQHLTIALIHAHFLKGEYPECLKLINKKLSFSNILCCRLAADLKITEVICYFEKKDDEMVHQKLEALRKFISRQRKGSETDVHFLIYTLLRNVFKQKPIQEELTQLISVCTHTKIIYGYEPSGLMIWLGRKKIHLLPKDI